MPHVIGAIYGKHVAMDCPKGSGTQDYNYKGFYIIVLLAVCDAKYDFMIVLLEHMEAIMIVASCLIQKWTIVT